MRPSEYIEKLLGIELLEYQKQLINKTAELPRKSNIVYGRNGKIYLVEKEKDNESNNRT